LEFPAVTVYFPNRHNRHFIKANQLPISRSADQVKKKTISDRDKEDLSMVVKKRKQKAAYCRCLATAQIPVPLGPEIQIKSRVIGFPKLTFFLQPSDMPVT
jgi:hypothetical protein